MNPGNSHMMEKRSQKKLARTVQALTALSHPVDLSRQLRAKDSLGEIRAPAHPRAATGLALQRAGLPRPYQPQCSPLSPL